MAKITGLERAGGDALDGTELVPIVQGGSTRAASLADLSRAAAAATESARDAAFLARSDAELARDVALSQGKHHPTVAAGEAATDTDDTFAVYDDGGRVTWYRRTPDASYPIFEQLRAANVPPATTLQDLLTRQPDIAPTIQLFRLAGYDEEGVGSGDWVADARANASLAARHPRACRLIGALYYRLMPDPGGYITPEQLGCPVPAIGVSCREYLQAAIHYAGEIGATVGLPQPQYDLWGALRPSGLPWSNITGCYLYVRHAFRMVGLGDAKVKLRLLNSQGGRNDVITQRVAIPDWNARWEGRHDPQAYPWIGHALVTVASHENPLAYFELANIEIDGTYTYNAATSRDPGVIHLDHKCIAVTDNVQRMDVRNADLHSFGGEIVYTAGSKNPSREYYENVHIHGSPQCALNSQTASFGEYINVTCSDSFQNEIIGGLGKRFVGGLWKNLRGAAIMGGAAGDGSFHNGYPYSFPFRNPGDQPPWVTFDGLVIENCPGVGIGSYARGTITAVDSRINLENYGRLEDVYLRIESVVDKLQEMQGVTIYGPMALDTQVDGAPPGTFFSLPTNIDVQVNCSRTRQAESVPHRLNADARLAIEDAVRVYAGMFGPSVKFTISGTADNAFRGDNMASKPGGVWPVIEVAEGFRRANPGMIGPHNSTSGNDPSELLLTPAPDVNALYANGPNGVWHLRCRPGRFADGGRIRIIAPELPGDGAKVVLLPASGAGMALQANRFLVTREDYVDLTWNSRINAWVEKAYFTAATLVMAGRVTYDAPLIAPGGTASTTVQVSGARVGDIVTGLSFGAIDLQGLVPRGEVTGNDTVTVWLTNPTNGTPDLPGANLRVQVTKGFAA